jgi:nicotinamidase-related amidase
VLDVVRADTALLIIDMQECYFDVPSLVEAKARLVACINHLTGGARRAGVPVLWVTTSYRPDLSDASLEIHQRRISRCIEGSGDVAILHELSVDAGDHHIGKKRYSAFFRTDLDALLLRLSIGTLIIAGIYTHSCVRMTAIDAYQRDHRVVIAVEGITSYDERHHDVSVRYMDGKIGVVATTDRIDALMTGGALS